MSDVKGLRTEADDTFMSLDYFPYDKLQETKSSLIHNLHLLKHRTHSSGKETESYGNVRR